MFFSHTDVNSMQPSRVTEFVALASAGFWIEDLANLSTSMYLCSQSNLLENYLLHMMFCRSRNFNYRPCAFFCFDKTVLAVQLQFPIIHVNEVVLLSVDVHELLKPFVCLTVAWLFLLYFLIFRYFVQSEAKYLYHYQRPPSVWKLRKGMQAMHR